MVTIEIEVVLNKAYNASGTESRRQTINTLKDHINHVTSEMNRVRNDNMISPMTKNAIMNAYSSDLLALVDNVMVFVK